VIDHWQPLVNSDLIRRLQPHVVGNVLCANLNQLGIQAGQLVSRRLHQEMLPEPMELFANNKRLPLASWPNQDWAQVQRITHSHSKATNTWSLERKLHPNDCKNAWAHGFWEHDWQDSFEPIHIDTNTNAISLGSSDGKSPEEIRNGARYRLCNVLSELDTPGEWYVDAASESLLYWPTYSDDSSPAVTVSTLETLLSLFDVEHVRFKDIRIETARAMLVEVVGGRNICFQDCTFSQSGNTAIHIFRGEHHQLIGCDVSCTGSSAIRVEGGDRATLTPANHLVKDCHVHEFGHHYRAGRPGISIYGVGTTLFGNHIHHGPDVAIGIHGNEHVIEQNEISHVCTETDDTSAIHLAFDPTYRGNQIRQNHIHTIGGFSKTGVIGIYLDDFASGTIVESNYLQNTVRGIAIGGGRDNRLENNVIHGAIAAIQIDSRGTTWARSHVHGENSRIQQLCRNTQKESPIYAEKYPKLTEMLLDQPELPKGNIVRANTYQAKIGIDMQQDSSKYVLVEGNTKQNSTVEDSDRVLAQLGIRLKSIAMPEPLRGPTEILVSKD
jgi:parallel beta-helix repeat protein